MLYLLFLIYISVVFNIYILKTTDIALWRRIDISFELLNDLLHYGICDKNLEDKRVDIYRKYEENIIFIV